ncbi:MAG TPA: hypothetical protein VMR95_03265 [Candidatus Binatia bacterium]|nr:hypothetical protein [Candidatus Binatia bacterium]
MASVDVKSETDFMLKSIPDISGTFTLEAYKRANPVLPPIEAEIAVAAISEVARTTPPNTHYPTPGWPANARCINKPLSFFNPGKGNNQVGVKIRNFCEGCIVKEDCKLDLLQDPSKTIEITFWRAGLSPKEQLKLRSDYRRSQAEK